MHFFAGGHPAAGTGTELCPPSLSPDQKFWLSWRRDSDTELTSGWSCPSTHCACSSQPWCMPRLPQAFVHLSWYWHTLKYNISAHTKVQSLFIQSHGDYRQKLSFIFSLFDTNPTWKPVRNSESSSYKAVLGDCVLCRPSLVVKALNLLGF